MHRLVHELFHSAELARVTRLNHLYAMVVAHQRRLPGGSKAGGAGRGDSVYLLLAMGSTEDLHFYTDLSIVPTVAVSVLAATAVAH